MISMTGQAPGAIPNGRVVVKVANEKGDAHKIGDRGRIVGSIATPSALFKLLPDTPISYFIEWDDLPGVPVFVLGWKNAEPP